MCSACKKLNLTCIEGSMPKSVSFPEFPYTVLLIPFIQRRNSIIEDISNISDSRNSPIPTIAPSPDPGQGDGNAMIAESSQYSPSHQGKVRVTILCLLPIRIEFQGRTIASILNDCYPGSGLDEAVPTKRAQETRFQDSMIPPGSRFFQPDGLRSGGALSNQTAEYSASEKVSPLGGSCYYFDDLVLRAITCQLPCDDTYVLSYCILSNLSCSRQYSSPECPVNLRLVCHTYCRYARQTYTSFRSNGKVIWKHCTAGDIQKHRILTAMQPNQLREHDATQYYPETCFP